MGGSIQLCDIAPALDLHGAVFLESLVGRLAIEAERPVVEQCLARQLNDFDTCEVPREFMRSAAAACLEVLVATGLMTDTGGQMSGTLINKRPQEGRRPWHQDWRWWNFPVSSRPRAVQVGMLIYFETTSLQNGATQAILGSHVNPDLHISGPAAYEDAPGAVTFCAQPGDCLLFDARTCHGTHTNLTDKNRLAVVIWHLLESAPASEEGAAFPLYGEACRRE